MPDFEIHNLEDGLTQIILSAPVGLEGILGARTNVYLVEDSLPTLINAGHPTQNETLLRALRACDTAPSDIERIICTSWEIGILGGATQFPRADLFVLSPDMQAPRDLEMQVDVARQHLLQRAAEMAEVDQNFRRQPVEDAMGRYYPRMTRNLGVIPLRNGHFVRAGPLKLEVLATAGPGPGHMALFGADDGYLFCGDFAMSGLPDRLDNAQGYLVSMDRLAELPAHRVLPNRGRSYTRGRLTVTRAARFINNFLTNVPSVLVQGPTVLDFIERDRGHVIENPVDLLLTFDVYHTLFEELVRTRTIAAEGEGMQRRYGVDVEDPRKRIRRI